MWYLQDMYQHRNWALHCRWWFHLHHANWMLLYFFLKNTKQTQKPRTTLLSNGFVTQIGCLIQQQDTQTKSMDFVPNQTQSAEDIRWYWAHGRNALGAGHVSGLGMVHLLLLHLERTQVNWQGEAKQHMLAVHAWECVWDDVCVFLERVAIAWTRRTVSAACPAWQIVSFVRDLGAFFNHPQRL